jgi:hypothetical protein
MRDLRREGPRIDVQALCWELVDDHETSGLTVDLSSLGLCLERPYTGGPTRREVPLQLEVPGIDEVMWAKADACFDVLVASPTPAGGALGLVRRTGYRIALAAARDLRMLKEFVIETDRVVQRDRAARRAGAELGARPATDPPTWRAAGWSPRGRAASCGLARRARGMPRPCGRS